MDNLSVPFWKHDCDDCLWLGGWMSAGQNRFDLYAHPDFEQVGLLFTIRMSDTDKLTYREDILKGLSFCRNHSSRELAALSALERWRGLTLYNQAMQTYQQVRKAGQ